MKKTLIFVLSLMMLVIFAVGCSSTSNNTGSTPTEAPVADDAGETTDDAGETADDAGETADDAGETADDAGETEGETDGE